MYSAMSMAHSIEVDASNFKTATIMEKEMNIILEGVKLEIHKMERPELKGIYTKAILGFDFYAAKYKDCEFILLEPQNKECCRYSMKLYAAISKWISEALGKPVAYFFDYRISDIWKPNNRGVYFILSDSYAFLPFLFDDKPYCIRPLE